MTALVNTGYNSRLMSAVLPELLDPLRAVDVEAAFAGSVPLQCFPRLGEILVESEGEARFDLAFRRDDDGHAIVVGSVCADLALECQRCLKPVRHRVDAVIALALVSGIDEARELPDHYEPLVPEERLIRPRDLLEDELLLGIPQVPSHPGDQCEILPIAAGNDAADSSDEPVQKNNPFAVLADRKQNDKP